MHCLRWQLSTDDFSHKACNTGWSTQKMSLWRGDVVTFWILIHRELMEHSMPRLSGSKQLGLYKLFNRGISIIRQTEKIRVLCSSNWCLHSLRMKHDACLLENSYFGFGMKVREMFIYLNEMFIVFWKLTAYVTYNLQFIILPVIATI